MSNTQYIDILRRRIEALFDKCEAHAQRNEDAKLMECRLEIAALIAAVAALVHEDGGESPDHSAYLACLPLVDALWWFIENVSQEDPHRNTYFFALRERMRSSLKL